MLSLAAIKKRSSTVVMQPLTTGEVITWRVYLLDPQDARRVPWLMDKVLRSASPQVDPDADPFAALEAEVARDGKSAADLEAEQLLECQRIACETAFEVQGLDEEDAAAWDPVRLVLDVDEQADAELGEDGVGDHPDPPARRLPRSRHCPGCCLRGHEPAGGGRFGDCAVSTIRAPTTRPVCLTAWVVPTERRPLNC